MTERRYLSVKEAAIYTGFHPDTVRKAARAEELQSYQRVPNAPYRFLATWLDRWMAGEEPPRKLQSLRRSA